jgi:hypothetical protein
VEAFHYAFGGTDLFVIGDLPDDASEGSNLRIRENCEFASDTV